MGGHDCLGDDLRNPEASFTSTVAGRPALCVAWVWAGTADRIGLTSSLQQPGRMTLSRSPMAARPFAFGQCFE